MNKKYTHNLRGKSTLVTSFKSKGIIKVLLNILHLFTCLHKNEIVLPFNLQPLLSRYFLY